MNNEILKLLADIIITLTAVLSFMPATPAVSSLPLGGIADLPLGAVVEQPATNYSVLDDATRDEDKTVIAASTKSVANEQKVSLSGLRQEINNIDAQIAKLQADKLVKENLIADIKLSLGLKEETIQ